MSPTELEGVEVERLSHSVIDEVERDREQLATRMIGQIAASITEYGFGNADGLEADVRAHCDANIRQFLIHARSGEVPAGSDLDFVREATRRRVQQGVPLDAVLHSFRIGHRVVWDALAERVIATGIDGSVAVEFARISMSYVDAVCTCVADTYLTEQQQALADADRSARDLLELILAGDPAAAAAAKSIGVRIDSSGRYLTMVATPQTHTSISPTELAGKLRRTFPVESRLVVVRQQNVISVLSCDATPESEMIRRCEEAMSSLDGGRPGGRVSLGQVGIGFDGIVVSHRQAVSALAVCSPERPVVSMSRITLLDYLEATAGEPAAALISEPVRGLALSTSTSDLSMVETLEAFAAAEMNIHRTASALPAHPNTVRYRLSRISERTSLQWRDPQQVIELLASIRLARRTG